EPRRFGEPGAVARRAMEDDVVRPERQRGGAVRTDERAKAERPRRAHVRFRRRKGERLGASSAKTRAVGAVEEEEALAAGDAVELDRPEREVDEGQTRTDELAVEERLRIARREEPPARFGRTELRREHDSGRRRVGRVETTEHGRLRSHA